MRSIQDNQKQNKLVIIDSVYRNSLKENILNILTYAKAPKTKGQVKNVLCHKFLE